MMSNTPLTSLGSIRPERNGDADGIRRTVEAAFRSAPHTSGTEAAIVDALRRADALTVSLVAEIEDAIVGQVAVSPVRIGGHDIGWHGLGPVAVHPDHQGTGIGAHLIRDALGRLLALGGQGCVVLGDPAYYGRFGFAPIPGLFYPGVPEEVFMALPFGTTRPTGRVDYHPGFSAQV